MSPRAASAPRQELEPWPGLAGFEGLEPLVEPLAVLEDLLGDLESDPLLAFAEGRLEAALRSGASHRVQLDPGTLARPLRRWLSEEPASRAPSVAALDAASANPALAIPWIGAAIRQALHSLDLGRVRPAVWPLLARWSEWMASQGPWRPRGLPDAARTVTRQSTLPDPWQLTTLVWSGGADQALFALGRQPEETLQEVWQRPLLALVGWGWERQVLALIERCEVPRLDSVNGVLNACADAGQASAVLRWLGDRSATELSRAIDTLSRCAEHRPDATLDLLRVTLEASPMLAGDLVPPLLRCLTSEQLESHRRTWVIDLLMGRLFAHGDLLTDRRFVGQVLTHEPERTVELMEHLVRFPFPQRASTTIARLLQRLPGFAPRMLQHLRSTCETLTEVLQAREALRQIERLGEPLDLDGWLDTLAESSPHDPRTWNDGLWDLAFALRGEDHRRILLARLRDCADHRHDLKTLHRRLQQTLHQGFRRCADERAIDLAIDEICRRFAALSPELLSLLVPIVERHGILDPGLHDFLTDETSEISLPEVTQPARTRRAPGHRGPQPDPLGARRRLLRRAVPGHLRILLPKTQARLWADLVQDRHRPLPVLPIFDHQTVNPGRSQVWTRYCGPTLQQVGQALGSGTAPVKSWLRRIAYERPPELTALVGGAERLVACLESIQEGLGERGFDPGLPPSDRLCVELILDEAWQASQAKGQTVNNLLYDPTVFSFSPVDLLDPRWRPIVRLLDPGFLRRQSPQATPDFYG